jgi:hypothetical protein
MSKSKEETVLVETDHPGVTQALGGGGLKQQAQGEDRGV